MYAIRVIKIYHFSRSHYLIVLKLEYFHTMFLIVLSFAELSMSIWSRVANRQPAVITNLSIILILLQIHFGQSHCTIHTIIIISGYDCCSSQKRKSNKETKNTEFYFYRVVNHRNGVQKTNRNIDIRYIMR